ncbi:hypothetical protein AC579_9142 [Pseudocercospora musae]|uniref:Uncharacterized protein n=1 Tax=Pseudocercospora musae TaxID=113226 RepID=A0A139IIU2_9PEZI|nr:hypothetical protein AC579_9142 [Pseudocercospora musae]
MTDPTPNMPEDHETQMARVAETLDDIAEGTQKRNTSRLTRLPGEIRNRIYELTLPAKDVYTLQYPRASGASDLISSPIFGIERQIRHEALTFRYPDSKVIVEPRPGFFLSQIPRSLNDLPFDVLKVSKEIEVKAVLLPPLSWSGGRLTGELLQVSFTVNAEGFYTTRAQYRPLRDRAYRRRLFSAEIAELRMYIEEQIGKLENLMLNRLEGRGMKRATKSRQIYINVIRVQ